jgi:shikimate kinase
MSGVRIVSEENKPGVSVENKPSTSEDLMQALLEERMKRYKQIAKYIAVGAAVYLVSMIWYMMHQ